MTEPLPRKRFQIHLSTLMIWVFVCGLLLRANLSPQRYYMDCALVTTGSGYSVSSYRNAPSTCYGWPFPFRFVVEHKNIPAGYSPYNIGEFAPLRKLGNGDYCYDTEFIEIPLNLFVWVCILIATPMICEWSIRRTSRRRA